ncbi:glycoside hydrolase family 43 protein [Halalkalibacter sp. APA_J-10(15)]|uniref:glycoside hydrolase family 43 protein n=1 Tax=Halalkalibacter sp. APA_J-10(15) TaxID=2933805 RepID=UPI001FF38AD9|nr:glycoside hydrolase family 43 protein [Halalkalibacter sp. APA_J-10(15)]MCK0473664.1 glycoside hydrolase family 43 protein [Halalkalibacter sp. APA_J-10(15)]
MIKNPILKGFRPDPSMIRVGDEYYIATSTFEWFPGVQIHHSKDLVNWMLLTYPLTRTSQLDLRGVPSSGGVWAPNLSYDNGTFYLLYTNVVNRTGAYKDAHNYLVTAKDINGPWSESIYLNSSGFDPALFHDEDGRKWLLNMQWNFRNSNRRFDGILLQEYSEKEQRLIGPVHKIIDGVDHWVKEGSNMYKRGEYYYIIIAEGGTGFNHSVTVARSKTITGPYEMDPNGPILTTRHNPDHSLQKAGHASIVETQTGDWYIAYLCARTLPGRKLCPLGRDTAIQKCYWTEDEWIRLPEGRTEPKLLEERPNLPLHLFAEDHDRDHFDGTELSIHFQTLRVPAEESWLSLRERDSFLRIYGRESLTSLQNQSIVARRLEDFECEIETCVEFSPDHFMQMAGLILYYDENDHFYLRISHDDKVGKNISVMSMNQGHYYEYVEDMVSIEKWERCYLRVSIQMDDVQFLFSKDGEVWQMIGPKLDFGQLSDEYQGKLGFTGSLVGMCVQDMSGSKKFADFDYFQFKSLET